VIERERERETEKTRKSWGDYASTIRKQGYVREPIETKYFIFRLLILLGSKGI
jgi:hypothetical protein